MFRKLKLAELNRLTIYQYKETKKLPVVVILDNVRSMNNVGSIFRTCDALGIESLYLCGITAVPPHREIHKTAIGAEESVHWEYFKDTTEACLKLKEKGYKLAAIEQAAGSKDLSDFNFTTKENFGLIFGNEVDGVSDEVMNLCDHCIEIPQFGTKHSFNVAVSAGIVLWEASRQIEITGN
ncbi:MAG: RNA methyltransferase [Bacteroidia bacterium]|nr:RNA methyltransferase [Bacteroidia bacterium]